MTIPYTRDTSPHGSPTNGENDKPASAEYVAAQANGWQATETIATPRYCNTHTTTAFVDSGTGNGALYCPDCWHETMEKMMDGWKISDESRQQLHADAATSTDGQTQVNDAPRYELIQSNANLYRIFDCKNLRYLLGEDVRDMLNAPPAPDVVELVESLKRYGKHDEDCIFSKFVGYEYKRCDCGYDALLSKYESCK